jgi:hypothetical protein
VSYLTFPRGRLRWHRQTNPEGPAGQPVRIENPRDCTESRANACTALDSNPPNTTLSSSKLGKVGACIHVDVDDTGVVEDACDVVMRVWLLSH